jgi:hypothetical protein
MKIKIALAILLISVTISLDSEIINGPPELDALENDKLMSCAEIIGTKLRNDQVNVF